MRVLLVDDEPDYLKQLSLLLEKENDKINIDTAESPVSGLEKVGEDNYDAVVSDYHMPEMDGLDFLVALRDGEHDLPFVLLTGKGREEVAMEALNLGADRYVRKGMEPKFQARVLAETLLSEVEERNYEKKLQEKEKRFRNIFEELGVPAVVINREGVIKLANKKFENVSGYSGGELEGNKKLHEFIPQNMEEKMEGNPVPLVEEVEVSKNTFKIQFKDKSGIVQDVLMNVSSVDDNDEFVVSILRFMN